MRRHLPALPLPKKGEKFMHNFIFFIAPHVIENRKGNNDVSVSVSSNTSLNTCGLELSRSLSHQAKHAEYVVCKPLSTDHNTNHNPISKLPAQNNHHNYLNMFASKLTLAVFTACAAFAKGQGNSTIVDIAVENGSFTTLVAAVTAAGLAETLSGDGPFTVLGKIFFILFAH